MIAASVLIMSLGLLPGGGNSQGLLTLIEHGWFELIFGEMSMLLVMCLALERWFAVVKPIQYRYKFCKSRVYIYVVFTIVTPLAISVHGMLPSYDPKSTHSKSLVFLNILLTLISPLLVTWSTHVYLWRHSKKQPTIQHSNSTKLKQKLVRMCAITAMFMTVCWIPTKLYYFIRTLLPTLDMPLILKSCDLLAMVNSIGNPWIYYFT